MPKSKTVNANEIPVNIQETVKAIHILLDTPAGHAALRTILKSRFPWLGTDDDANGGDTVNELNEWYSLNLR